MRIEFQVRPVTRFIVTSHEQNDEGTIGTGGRGHGEFDNEEMAYQVGYALARAAHERLGYPIGDERVKYPTRPL